MGIRHLYTHLSPYARPESFPPPDSAEKTPIYVDGPALCHHVYHLIFCAGSQIGGNALETTLSYRPFAEAFGSYLARLEASGFEIKKIFFDSALPAAKTPTRISRLEDSLRKLSRYRSLNPTLRYGTPSSLNEPETFFSPAAPISFTARTQHLSAPPFIVAAALSWLSAHTAYRELTETVPGEADPFLAAAAIRNGGIVLTGDSDLLVFSGQEKEWGVVMMQDLSFSDSGVTARVFRPTRIAESLRYPLLEVAYQTFLDAQASLNQILERLQRVEERRRQGVGEQKIPDEFTLEYALPPLAKEPRRTVEEPRIGELLFLADEKKPAEERKMYFPFLIEDSQRAPAWETGTAIRALAYGLLFGDGEVREVFRRGTRISDSAVGCGGVAEKVARLAQAVEEAPESWWASIVLEEICDIAQARGQGPPTDNELSAAAASLLPKGALATGKVKKKWNWALLHMFAMTQAGWYSLLLLREVLAYLESCGIAVVGCDVENLETLKRGLLQLPDVLDLFDGQRFLGGFEGAQPEAKKIGKAVLARYWAADAAAAALVVEEEEAAEIGEAQDVEEEEEVVMVESPVNGNGKRPGAGVGQVLKPVVEAEMDLWSTVQSKSAKKRKRKKVVSAMAARGGGNKFAVLSTEM